MSSALTFTSGRFADRLRQVSPPSAVRKTCPRPAPDASKPPNTTYAIRGSSGSTAISLTGRTGSGPAFVPATLFHVAPRSMLAHTSPFRVPA